MAKANATAAPITPIRAGYGGLKAISIAAGPAGSMQIKQALAVATTTRDRAGCTLAEVRERYIALSAPLWGRSIRAGAELRWVMRQPGTPRGNRRGATHGCAHTAKKGAKQKCYGGHEGKASTCTFEFVSKGDSVERWRNGPLDGHEHEVPSFDGNKGAIRKAARAAMRAHIDALRAGGFSAADMAATPSIADAVRDGLLDASSLGGRKARKATATAGGNKAHRGDKAAAAEAQAPKVDGS